MVRAALNGEDFMSKTNDTSKLGQSVHELTEAELNAAVGGRITNVRMNVNGLGGGGLPGTQPVSA